MAPLVRPVAGSPKKVYIARSGGADRSVSLSAKSGEAVEFVDSSSAATETVRVYVGSKAISRSTAKRLQKACEEEQRRQRKNKRDKGVFDQIIADLEKPRRGESDRLRFATAIALAGLIWVGAAVGVAQTENVGVALLALLCGVAMVPLIALMLQLFDAFLPSGLTFLAGLGLVGVVWAGALGIIDVQEPASERRSSLPAAAPPAEGNSGENLASGELDASAAPDPSPSPVGAETDWPGGGDAYTVIVASKPERAEAAAVAARAERLPGPSGVLHSDAYTTLLPGYWVAFAGVYDNVERAFDAARRARAAGFPGAFAELISRRPQAPSGTVTATSVGAVQVGMSTAEVGRHFTPPDSRQIVNFGSGPAPEVDWIWLLPGGELTLQFDRRRDELASYETSSSAFATTSGIGVGDSFIPIQRKYGSQLRISPVGEHTVILSEGRPGTYPALTFHVYDQVVEGIGGGIGRPAGE
jgi:hypothetical protein